jgi:hypothetical protein
MASKHPMKMETGIRSFMDSPETGRESVADIDHGMSIAAHRAAVAQPGINAPPTRISAA